MDDPRLQELYESLLIFCLPSSRENASISLLEARLAGMAVVTSNVTGCTGRVVSPDMLRDCGPSFWNCGPGAKRTMEKKSTR